MKPTKPQQKIIDRLKAGEELSAPSGPHSLGMFRWKKANRANPETVSTITVLSMRDKGLVSLRKHQWTIKNTLVTAQKTIVDLCESEAT